MIPYAMSQCLQLIHLPIKLRNTPITFAARETAKRVSALALTLAYAGFLIGCAASLNDESATRTSLSEQQANLAAVESVATAPPIAPSVAPTSSSSAYKIGPQDVLEITVFKVEELSKTVQVSATGTINLPLVGEIPAAGRTAHDVERELVAKLGAKYLKSPQVTVFVKEYNSQQITVEGSVRKPGVYPIKGKTSLLQSIAMAEGLDPSYDSTVIIFRRSEGQRLAARFDIDSIKKGEEKDPEIYKGDLVVVNSSTVKNAYQTVLKALPAGGSFIRQW
jgi:polysaccharide export outer membrane protein